MTLSIVADQLIRGRRPETLALLWGCLLPIEFVLDVPPTLLDVPRYVLGGLIVLSVPATLPEAPRRPLRWLLGLLFVLGLLRVLVGLHHDDGPGARLGYLLVGSSALCWLLALRPRVHRSVLVGFALGVTASAVVCLMQATGIPTLRPPGPGEGRYPGLSRYTMSLTWQVLFAGLIATYLWSERPRSPRRWLWMAVVVVCAIALLINGAQGGLLGAGAAALAFVAWSESSLRRRAFASPWPIAVVGGLAAVAAVLVASGVKLPIFADWIEGDYVNEQARVDIARVGWHTFLDHPVLGVGRRQFFEANVIAPHFLPLESAVSAGILAGLAASAALVLTWWQMFRRPAPGRYALLGAVLLAAMCANTLTEVSGPFIGISHQFLLVIAIVAARGFGEARQQHVSKTLDVPSAQDATARFGGT